MVFPRFEATSIFMTGHLDHAFRASLNARIVPNADFTERREVVRETPGYDKNSGNGGPPLWLSKHGPRKGASTRRNTISIGCWSSMSWVAGCPVRYAKSYTDMCVRDPPQNSDDGLFAGAVIAELSANPDVSVSPHRALGRAVSRWTSLTNRVKDVALR